MGLTRRECLKTLGAAGMALAAPGFSFAGKETPDQPNILFIMSDDHAVNAFGCYGSRLAGIAPTQNIDRLAAQGMRLDACLCTNSICVPSRASILTGEYSHKNGVYTLSDRLDPERENVAKMIRASGYQTATIGKWHLKEEPAGFDYWNILPGQGRYHNPILKEIGTGEKTYEGYSTDIITDLSIKWLHSRKEDKPFFLMCHYKASHEPWHYAERHEELFRDIEIPEPESLWEDKSHRSEGSREYGFTISTMVSRMERKNHATGPLDTSGMDETRKKRAGYQKFVKDYLRTVAGIDENVGRLLDYLDREGLAENTVVIYTSDQGYFLGEHDYIDKRWMFEESLRMPFIVRYPPETAPGSINSDLILNVDFAPLFLDYAGVPAAENMQGRSFRANLHGQTPPDWRESMYYRYWQHCSRPAHYGVRTKHYKLIFYYGLPLDANGAEKTPTKPGWELYDLQKDPHELRNVYNNPSYAGVVKELKQELLRLKDELGDRDENYPELMELRHVIW